MGKHYFIFNTFGMEEKEEIIEMDTFDLSWKVLKELVTHEFGITDFAAGSPRETLKLAFSVGLINDDRWMDMLRVRNTLAHDYDGRNQC